MTHAKLPRAVAAAACALVALGAASCRGDEGSSPAGDGSAPGAARRVRRLSAREYADVVEDLVGERVDPARLAPDSYETGYDNGTASLTVQPAHAVAFEAAAGEAALAAVAHARARLVGGCDASASGPAACRDALLAGFAPRAFRRPLRATETQRLSALFDASLGEAGYDAALATTVSAILQSPALLYREELGADPAGSNAPVTLTAYELASELSFFLTGSTPDDELLAAASGGALATPDGVRREASRLLDTPRARAQLARFFDEWLATARLATTTKDARAYPAFDAPLAQAMRAEIDALYASVVAGDGSLAALFGTTGATLDARLAQHYGAPASGAVTLDRATRAGVLARAGFLTVHSAFDGSNPIERGVFVRSAIMCAAPHPPPPGIPRDVPADAARTTRQRFEEHTANPFCQTCHAAIDGVGFGFEQFDGTGALRATENGVAVDSSGDLEGSGEADGRFVGVVELESRLVASPRVSECLVRQMFRFAMGRGETDADAESIRELSRAFRADTPLRELVLDLVGRRLFRQRWLTP